MPCTCELPVGSNLIALHSIMIKFLTTQHFCYFYLLSILSLPLYLSESCQFFGTGQYQYAVTCPAIRFFLFFFAARMVRVLLTLRLRSCEELIGPKTSWVAMATVTMVSLYTTSHHGYQRSGRARYKERWKSCLFAICCAWFDQQQICNYHMACVHQQWW